MASLMDKLPGVGAVPQQVKDQVNDKELVKIEALNSSIAFDLMVDQLRLEYHQALLSAIL